MKKKTLITLFLLLIVIILSFARCKTIEPGVIMKTKNARIVNNGKHFQQRADAKAKRKEILLTNKN